MKLELKRRVLRRAAGLLALAGLGFPAALAQVSTVPGSQDALQLQETRNRFVKERAKRTYYPADKFDLSGLPSYKPDKRVSGTLRIWGNNYLDDSGLSEEWEKAFRKFHPNVKFTWTMPTAAVGVGALYSGAADIGATGRVAMFPERLGFQRRFKYDLTEIVVTTGSFNVAGWSNALGFFVHKDNPIDQLTFSQLDGVFGAEREGGWGRDFEWHRDVRRGPEKNIRTWGQLGLTGEWADKPINTYGLNLRYEQSQRISDPILKGSDKWNEKTKLFANYTDEQGKLITAAAQIMQHVGNDRYGIGYGGMMNLTPQTKPIALAANDGGPHVALTLENVQNRSYPLIGETYFYVNRKPGTRLDPKVEEFVRFVLSREGQQLVARDGKYLPLTAEAAEAQRKKLD